MAAELFELARIRTQNGMALVEKLAFQRRSRAQHDGAKQDRRQGDEAKPARRGTQCLSRLAQHPEFERHQNQRQDDQRGERRIAPAGKQRRAPTDGERHCRGNQDEPGEGERDVEKFHDSELARPTWRHMRGFKRRFCDRGRTQLGRAAAALLACVSLSARSCRYACLFPSTRARPRPRAAGKS